ncbi:cation-dependent mannose-6-phosphate receptor-like isoform X2 [Halichondria panicea]
MTYDYVFSPCGAKIDCGNTSKPVVICQSNRTSQANVVVGASSSVVWTFASESDTNQFTVTYRDGDNTYDEKTRKGVISVTVTAQGNPSFVFIGENPVNDNELDYVFAAKIPPGGVSPGIVGIVLICVVLGAVILYFIIGSIVMFQVKGARGIEVVPNYSFWKDLPFLIKDGFLFTFQPCLSGCSKKNTYSHLVSK